MIEINQPCHFSSVWHSDVLLPRYLWWNSAPANRRGHLFKKYSLATPQLVWKQFVDSERFVVRLPSSYSRRITELLEPSDGLKPKGRIPHPGIVSKIVGRTHDVFQAATMIPWISFSCSEAESDLNELIHCQLMDLFPNLRLLVLCRGCILVSS